ncbi:MAG: acyl-CoA dehydrogenase [Firmicutes bacterium]|nr:acyl-CoA dehydrogenase [Bacillota bacterium]
MRFELTEEQKMVVEMARDFAEKEIAPTVEYDDEHHLYRPEITKKMAELGLLGFAIKEEYGGNGMGFMEGVLAFEEISAVHAAWRLPLNMQAWGPAYTIQRYGTEKQKQEFIEKFVTAEYTGSFAITEPNSGSDVVSMNTTAVDKGDYFELNGQKMWISNGHVTDWGLVYAMTDKAARYKGMTCFLVNYKWEGVTANPIHTKFGLHAAPTSEVVFENVKVPKEYVLGQVGQGFPICMWQLNNTRLGCALAGVGIALASLRASIQYANERTQFGKKIGAYQLIQEQIVEIHLLHHAARMACLEAGYLKDHNLPNQLQTSTAKLAAAHAAVTGANLCMKIHGSYGYSTEYPCGRLLRDAKSMEILEGTSNIQTGIIAGILLGDAPNRSTNDV